MVLTSLDKIKRELLEVNDEVQAAHLAQLTAMIRFTSGVRTIKNQLIICPHFDSLEAAKWIQKEFKELFKYDSIIKEVNSTTDTEIVRRYVVLMNTDVLNFALKLGLIDRRSGLQKARPLEFLVNKTTQLVAAWRGAFIAQGRLSESGSNSYLEVVCPTPAAAESLQAASNRLEVVSTIRTVGNSLRVIVSGDEEIEKLLNILGSFTQTDAWAKKLGVGSGAAKNSRLLNFDDANMRRSAKAAAEACAKVKIGFELLGDNIPANLRAVGELRLEHEGASLEELGRYAEPQLTKDAVAGRLRRLLQLVDKAMANSDRKL